MRVKLKDIASFSKGKQINGEDLIDNGRYDFLNGGINPSGRWNEYNVEGNSIAISEGGNSCGYVNYMTNPFWCGAHCYYLYDLKYHSKYIYYALKSQQDRVMQLRSGACMPNIKKNDLAEFELSIDMDPERQADAVTSLDRVCELIALRQTQLTKLDQLVKSRFVEMFGNPVHNDNHLPIKRLSALGSLDRGRSKHRPRNDPALLNGPYPLIQTGEVSNSGLYITTYQNTYSELGLQQSRMWKAGTLCITIAANIAQTAILGFDACFPDSVVGFVPYEEVSAVYMHYWFSFFQKILEEQAPQVAQKNINLKILSELEVMVPSKADQDSFLAFVEQTNKSKLTIQSSLDKLELLKKSLMQQYFG